MFVANGLGYSYALRRTSRLFGDRFTKCRPKAREKPRVPLSGLSFEIPLGTTTAVLGLSGSGKSTLLGVMGLLLDPRQMSGTLSLKSQQYDKLSVSEQVAFRSKKFGFVLQSAYMLPGFSCAENVILPSKLQGNGSTNRYRSALQLEELVESIANSADERDELLRERPSKVSGGQQQRMAVLRAISHDPDVVFADEPCASLDPVNSDRVMELLSKWQLGNLSITEAKKERTLILVTHNFESAFSCAQSFLLLRKGKMVTDSILSRSSLPRLHSGKPDSEQVKQALETGDVKAFYSGA